MIDKLAITIDACSDANDIIGLEKAIKKCFEHIQNTAFEDPHISLVYYFIANAYSSIRRISETKRNISIWDWENSYRDYEILNLRKCISHPSFKRLEDQRKCEVYTNLGNIFNNTGRPIQAISMWNKAINIDQYFSMAVFNKAHGLCSFAGLLFDEGHKFLIFEEAYRTYQLLNDKSYLVRLEDYSSEHIIAAANLFCNWWLENRDNISNSLGMYHDCMDAYNESLGESIPEVEYRKWFLENNLFINPLNDIGKHTLAARDVFFLPSITVSCGEGPYLQSLFQQMCQEFASARFMCYQGLINHSKSHFCDSDIVHIDTLDYPKYGYWTDMIKASFKTIYGLLDRIGTFINEYFCLGKKFFYFRTLWYKKGKINNTLEPQFLNSANLPLRGLYWLSKDLINDLSKTDNHHDYLEPEAQRIAEIRNKLEHSYVRMVEYDSQRTSTTLDADFSTVITFNDFQKKSLYLLSIVREALMNLALSVNIEENIKNKNIDDNLITRMELPIL